MNTALKILERQAEALYIELKLASDNNTISHQMYSILKQTSIDMINVKRNIEKARTLIITH